LRIIRQPDSKASKRQVPCAVSMRNENAAVMTVEQQAEAPGSGYHCHLDVEIERECDAKPDRKHQARVERNLLSPRLFEAPSKCGALQVVHITVMIDWQLISLAPKITFLGANQLSGGCGSSYHPCGGPGWVPREEDWRRRKDLGICSPRYGTTWVSRPSSHHCHLASAQRLVISIGLVLDKARQRYSPSFHSRR
jgi:hypothetical protein